MELEERLERLEDGQRDMAAQQIALMHVSRVMFALIGIRAQDVDKALLLAYDQACEHMDKEGMDTAFQRAVRAKIETLSELISGVARTPDQKPDAPAAAP